MNSQSQGIAIEYLGTWFEIDGKEGQRIHQWRPLVDTLRCLVGIRNCGKKAIDHWTWKQTVDLSSTKVELIQPRLATQLWRPLASGVFVSVLMREIKITEGKVEVSDPILHRIQDALVLSQVSSNGLEPGETLIVGEKKPFVEFLKEGVAVKSVQKGVEAWLEIEDRDKGIVLLAVKEVKLGPLSLRNLKARVTLRGKSKAVHEVSIDGKVYATGEVEWEYI